jgi:hypothetical protein
MAHQSWACLQNLRQKKGVGASEFGATLEGFLLLEFQLCIAWLSIRVQCPLIRFCEIT